MNRKNRARIESTWAAVAKDAAGRAGFDRVGYPLQGGDAFRLAWPVSPCVQFFIQRVTATEVAPLAFVGVYVEAFEGEWRDRLLQTDLSPELDDLPFGLHVGNVAGLRPRPWVPTSPSDQDIIAVQVWLGRVFEYARRLPSSIGALVTAVEANQIADHTLAAYRGHSLKVRGLVQWLRRTHGIDVGAQILPLLTDQTDPYDVRVMLGEP